MKISLPASFPAFDEVLESCRRFLLAVAERELPDDLRAKGGASDLVQQTLTAAIRSEHQFRGQTVEELRGWLRAILRSEAAAFRRRFSGTAARNIRREVSLDGITPAESQTPFLFALRAEQTARLSAAVTQLPEKFQQVVLLRVEHELSFAEIGARLGRSEEASRKLFTRALAQLRGQLAPVTAAESPPGEARNEAS